MIHTIYNAIVSLIYIKNRLLLRLAGLKFGKNLQVISIYRIAPVDKIKIGDNVVIRRFVTFGGESGIIIGNNVIIADFVSLISANHNYTNPDTLIINQGMKIEDKPIFIEDNVWIGEKATILKRVHIGKGAVIGANSVVTKDIPAYTVAAGNPARVIKFRPKPSIKK